MKTLIFSLYYPHDQRPLLAKEGILPLIEQPNIYRFNYFLSLHKGENITIQMVGNDDAELRDLVEGHFVRFFEYHRVPLREVVLPTNKMFLDFPYNTLHIWEKDPFHPGMFGEKEVAIDDYQNLLSKRCLHVLASLEERDESVSFEVFIELLFYLCSYINYQGANVNEFLFGLMDTLELRMQVQKQLIQKYMMQGVGIYQQNASDIHDHYRKISTQIQGFLDNDDGDWLKIFEVMANKQDLQKENYLITKLCKEFVFDVTQKIDLDQKGLVLACAVVLEMTKNLL